MKKNLMYKAGTAALFAAGLLFLPSLGNNNVGFAATGIVTQSGVSAQELVNQLLGGGVTVSNVKFNGSAIQEGVFTGGADSIGFDQGIVLSSGNIQNIIGPNYSGHQSTSLGRGGDGNLSQLINGVSTYDASVLEFDFVPENDVISFQYVFGSEEYNEYVGGSFNDVFGFFINGQNMALIPNTTTPVSINNINLYKNAGYYNNNDYGAFNTGMDGFTKVLSVEAPVKKGEVNHIKIAIADAGDTAYDSHVLIKAGSFKDQPAPEQQHAPVVTASADPSPNENGWYNGDVTVTFNATDADNDLVSVDNPVTVTNEGYGIEVNGSAVDSKGQTGSASLSLNIDKTSPVTTAAPTGTEGANGWYTSDVNVALNANDALSGVAKTEYSLDGGDTWSTYTAPFTLSNEGSNTVLFRSTDQAGNVEAAKQLVVNIDKTAPTTTDNAPSGWQNHDFSIDLSATDDESGVDQTYYAIDNGVLQTGTSVSINTEGVHEVTYYSVDLAGNQEASHSVTVKLDKTAPKTTDNAPTGWQNHDFSIDLSATDDGSGVDQTYYAIDNGNLQTGTSVSINTEGTHKVTYYSVDQAGNQEATHTITVKLDKTAPTLSVNLSLTTLWSPNHKMIPIDAIVNANDNISGVAKVVLTSITSNEPDQVNNGDKANDIQNADFGTFDTSFALRAERLANGTGRVYTITYTVTDNAGNSTTVTKTVDVPHDQGK